MVVVWCCGVSNVVDGNNITISHVTVTVTGTGGAGGAGLQLTLYTYSARWLTEVSLSHQVHTRDIPTTNQSHQPEHSTFTLCHT